RCWVEWRGGGQAPIVLDIKHIKIPVVSQPKKIATGATCYGETIGSYPDYFAMMRSLGFNTIDSWGVGARAGGKSPIMEAFRAHGMDVDWVHSGLSDLAKMLPKVKDAQSVAFNGTRKPGVIDASHRGKIFKRLLNDMEGIAAAGLSGIKFDDEHYRDWASMDTCVCERCKGLWKTWLAKKRPGLQPVMPEVFLDDPLNHLQQYQAWWMFRASLVTEWYAAARGQFVKSVRKHRSQSTDRVRIASYTSPAEFSHIKSSYANPAELAGIWDRIAPMYYETGYDVRRHMRSLVRAVGRKHAYATLCMGEARRNRWIWRPGELRAQMLEVLFAGGMGYSFWSWPYSNLRIIAEVAETNGIVADNEEVFLKGTRTDRFRTDQDRCFATTLETEAAGLLLVSNYTRTDNHKVWIRRRPTEAMTLTELYTGHVLRLAAGQQSFAVEVAPQNCTLWKWQTTKSK
ncbi:hypothetical protein LCGC14_1324630, partial [marine sediment metagenome]